MFTKINFQRLTASYCKSNKLKNIWKNRVGGAWFTDWMRATSSAYVRKDLRLVRTSAPRICEYY